MVVLVMGAVIKTAESIKPFVCLLIPCRGGHPPHVTERRASGGALGVTSHPADPGQNLYRHFGGGGGRQVDSQPPMDSPPVVCVTTQIQGVREVSQIANVDVNVNVDAETHPGG